jgi:hypothetical protein
MDKNRDKIPLMQLGREDAYRAIRDALGRLNDENRPVIELVEKLAKEKADLRSQIKSDKKAECQHENWTIFSVQLAGKCTCLDCGTELCVCDAFNRLRDRMLEVIEKPESDLADLTPQRPATPDTRNYP